MLSWKINSSIDVKVDRFGVVVDQVVLPNGEETTYSYLNLAKGVCILPFTNDQKVICLKKYRHAVKSWQWELPAWMMDREGDSPLDTAKRELEEETGFTAEHWLDLGSFYPSPGTTTEEIHLFAATGLTASEQNLDTSEQMDIHTVTMEELKNLISNGEFNQGAGLAAILRYKFMVD